ncbi:MAG: membrane protein insertase YidC [Spirochaetes bacterium]|nr:membrane protein insertase YidC [Spirochaetota bacterium]
MSDNPYQKPNAFDGKTMLAVVLSVAVIAASFAIQTYFFPPKREPLPAEPTTQQAPAETPGTSFTAAPTIAAGPRAAEVPATVDALEASIEKPSVKTTHELNTDVFTARFTNEGGELVSLKLRKHSDKGGFVDIMLPDEGGTRGFAIAFGDAEAPPYRELMNFKRIDDRTVEFHRAMLVPTPGKAVPSMVTLRKRYTFMSDEYMFRLEIVLENAANEVVPFNKNGMAYTLSFGPGIGPSYDDVSARSDFRKFINLENGKPKEFKPKGGRETIGRRVSWTSIVGKYFELIAIPDATPYAIGFESAMVNQRATKNVLYFTRPVIKAGRQTDSFLFYAGPRTSAELARYDDARKNGFGRSADKLEESLLGGSPLGWLEQILKVALKFFYGIIPNYGVAIILVTLLVKVLTFPLTHKGSEASARMQELQPKMQELQAKYKSNPQKLNAEMAAFYQKEGYNPLAGCLPLLIQFPLFIAMYSLFNTHFDLRGAMFIPGWIPDLSQPESVFNFPMISLVIWKVSAIRLLPMMYLGSQLLYGMFTQTPQTGQNASQMKFMMYGMPLMFFFILYDVPSGLLVYWIASNVLTIGQQVLITDIMKKRKAAKQAVAAADISDAARFVGSKKSKKK